MTLIPAGRGLVGQDDMASEQRGRCGTPHPLPSPDRGQDNGGGPGESRNLIGLLKALHA